PQSSDREMGEALKEMFAAERASIRAVVEAQLAAPAPENDELPSIPVFLGNADGTSSYPKKGTSSLPPRVSSLPPSTLPTPPPAPSSFPTVESAVSSQGLPALAGRFAGMRAAAARLRARYGGRRAGLIAIGAAGAVQLVVLGAIGAAITRATASAKRPA